MNDYLTNHMQLPAVEKYNLREQAIIALGILLSIVYDGNVPGVLVDEKDYLKIYKMAVNELKKDAYDYYYDELCKFISNGLLLENKDKLADEEKSYCLKWGILSAKYFKLEVE